MTDHDKKMLQEIDAGVTLPGVRLGSKKDGGSTGTVVTLTPEEQKPVIEAIRKAVAARK
jgi:hypothetical protein